MSTPASNSRYIGTAMIDCEMASGGVMNAATMNYIKLRKLQQFLREYIHL